MIRRVFCLLLAILLTVTGCQTAVQREESAGSGQIENQDSAASSIEESNFEEALQPVEGGTLRLAIENPKTLLPWEVTDEATGKMLMLIYSPLMNMAEDGSMQPCLAKSWNWSKEAPEELVVELRSDVTFHNGKQLTAGDVIYSVQKLQSSGNVYSTAVQGIAQVETLDESSVLFRFSAPGRMNEEGLIFPIVPEGYTEKLIPMGTGPFAYKSAESMREMQLKRYEGYFEGAAYITDVTVYFVREKAAVLQCFETTRTNLMQTDYFEWGAYVNQKNLTVHAYDSYEAVYLEFNENSSFGAVYSNREKTAYAVDAVRVLRDAYWGKGEVTETLIRPASWYKEGATKHYGYNAEKAKNMEAKGTSQVRLLYHAQDPVLSTAVETIRQQLEASGLTVTLVTSGSYDIALRRGSMTLMDAAKAMGDTGILSSAATDAQIKAAVVQLDAMMNESLRFYNLFFLTQATVTGYGLHGNMQPSDWNAYGGAENLYSEEAKRS